MMNIEKELIAGRIVINVFKAFGFSVGECARILRNLEEARPKDVLETDKI